MFAPLICGQSKLRCQRFVQSGGLIVKAPDQVHNTLGELELKERLTFVQQLLMRPIDFSNGLPDNPGLGEKSAFTGGQKIDNCRQSRQRLLTSGGTSDQASTRFQGCCPLCGICVDQSLNFHVASG